MNSCFLLAIITSNQDVFVYFWRYLTKAICDHGGHLTHRPVMILLENGRLDPHESHVDKALERKHRLVTINPNLTLGR